jgi:alpha-tubulin suppressor-like RCC1 family protein
LGGFGDPPQRRPVGILGGQRWREVGVGDGHACAINLNSVVYCWGRGYAGQLGDGTSDGRPRPAAIATTGDSTFFGLSVGDDHACAIRARDGQLFCWGRNTNGQVGNGTTSSVTSPVAITGLVNLSRVVAGPRHTCASGPDTFWCWGANAAGQLGLGDQSDRTTPQVVVSQGGIPTSFALGGDEDPEHGFTCAVTEGPGVSCAGANGRGQLATGAISAPSLTFIPAVALPIGEVYTAVTAGAAHACAGAFTGTWYCWGANDLRQASFDDATFTILGPDPVSGATVGVPARLRNARDASCALVQGSWRCFGRRNRVGEMGSGVIGRTEVLESIR